MWGMLTRAVEVVREDLGSFSEQITTDTAATAREAKEALERRQREQQQQREAEREEKAQGGSGHSSSSPGSGGNLAAQRSTFAEGIPPGKAAEFERWADESGFASEYGDGAPQDGYQSSDSFRARAAQLLATDGDVAQFYDELCVRGVVADNADSHRGAGGTDNLSSKGIVKVSDREFWSRYFFRLALAELEEKRRAALVRRLESDDDDGEVAAVAEVVGGAAAVAVGAAEDVGATGDSAEAETGPQSKNETALNVDESSETKPAAMEMVDNSGGAAAAAMAHPAPKISAVIESAGSLDESLSVEETDRFLGDLQEHSTERHATSPAAAATPSAASSASPAAASFSPASTPAVGEAGGAAGWLDTFDMTPTPLNVDASEPATAAATPQNAALLSPAAQPLATPETPAWAKPAQPLDAAPASLGLSTAVAAPAETVKNVDIDDEWGDWE